MKKTNIVLFSSGMSEQSGILSAIKNNLNNHGCLCSDWRDLFSQAKRQDQIALLPMLIKKIPTFDYAVLICEGHDKVQVTRNGEIIEYNAMRDNVLFEIGLCCMALGLSKVILVTDGTVRLPDDLVGKENSLAIMHIPYIKLNQMPWDNDMALPITNQIEAYINNSTSTVSPVVIGAATSTACGYANNFISRTLEKIDTGIELFIDDKCIRTTFPLENIYIHVVLPAVMENGELLQDSLESDLSMGRVPNARNRAAEFKYLIKDENLHIYDFPTTVATSYDIASMILDIDADDRTDSRAKLRFVEKEVALFESSLKALMNREYFANVINGFYKNASDEEKRHILNNVTSIVTERLVLEHAGRVIR